MGQFFDQAYAGHVTNLLPQHPILLPLQEHLHSSVVGASMPLHFCICTVGCIVISLALTDTKRLALPLLLLLLQSKCHKDSSCGTSSLKMTALAIQVQGVALAEHHEAAQTSPLRQEQLKQPGVQQQMQTSRHHGQLQPADGANSFGNGRYCLARSQCSYAAIALLGSGSSSKHCSFTCALEVEGGGNDAIPCASRSRLLVHKSE